MYDDRNQSAKNHHPIFSDIKHFKRLITYLENNDPRGTHILESIPRSSKDPFVLGVTGPPGSGKSSLINKLVINLRENDFNNRICIILVDPSSPITGGSIMGDRIRMQKLFLEKDILIRSFSTRGQLGGLISSILNVLRAMMIWTGPEGLIILETTGTGQNETEISKIADTVALILNPESGDDVQSIKAGIMEIAHLYIVNKSDLPKSDILLETLTKYLEITPPDSNYSWKPALIEVSAKENTNFSRLRSLIFQHYNWLKSKNLLEVNKKNRIQFTMIHLLENELKQRFQEFFTSEKVKTEMKKILEGTHTMQESYNTIKNIFFKIISEDGNNN